MTGATSPCSPAPIRTALLGALLAALVVVPPLEAECVADELSLCLQGERFRVQLSWEDFEGETGPGHAELLTSDTGYFWFFAEENVEVVVKVLDGRPLNGHFWVFFGALSNVGYTLTVVDSETGRTASYSNPVGTFGSRGDVTALPAGPEPSEGWSPASSSPLVGPSGGSALTGDEALALRDDRFEIRVEWEDFQGNRGVGRPIALTSDTGAFWFFDPDNLELVVKVLDGRSHTDHFWVFYGSLTNVGFRLVVTDTLTGRRRVLDNPLENFASVGDVEALSEEPLAGFGFSPRYFASVESRWLDEEVLREFYEELERSGLGLWAANGEWWELRESEGELLPWIETFLGDYPSLAKNVVGAVQLADLATGLPRVDPDSGWAGTWEDWEERDGWGLYREAILALVRRHAPMYLSVGVEINNFARFHPEAFERFATVVFPALVEAVHEIEPETIVFPGFQFEQMIGDLRGFAGPDGTPGCPQCVPFDEINSLDGRTYPAMVDVLNLFPPEFLSHVGFTSYPHFNRDFEMPGDLPGDYYTRIDEGLDAEHQDVRLVFTEYGWPSAAELSPVQACLLCGLIEADADPVCSPQPVPDGACDEGRMQELVDFYRPWLGGEQEQLDFVERFRDLTSDLHPGLAVWLALHDADELNPAALFGLFTSHGLRSHDGTRDKPALERWMELWGQ